HLMLLRNPGRGDRLIPQFRTIIDRTSNALNAATADMYQDLRTDPALRRSWRDEYAVPFTPEHRVRYPAFSGFLETLGRLFDYLRDRPSMPSGVGDTQAPLAVAVIVPDQPETLRPPLPAVDPPKPPKPPAQPEKPTETQPVERLMLGAGNEPVLARRSCT